MFTGQIDYRWNVFNVGWLLGLVDKGNWESTYSTAQKKFTSHVSFPTHYAILVARNENHVKKDFVDG